jgi:hypothetical protein
MKIPLALFFAFGAPLAVFLATVLYTGHTRDTVKQALAESPVYKQISEHFSAEDFNKRFTPEYFRNKTEETLDTSASWIAGRTQSEPVVSFKEIKEDLQKSQPDLLTAIQETPTTEQLEQSGMDDQQSVQFLNQAKQLRTFTANDFTIPLAQYLQSVKTVYHGLQIALPVYIIILLASLLMIVLFANSIHTKWKWLGITFFLSSVFGFAISLFYRANSEAITHLKITDQTEFITFITPIILTIIKHFVSVYAANQLIVSVVFLILAVICFVITFLTKGMAAPAVKPLKVKRTYWTEPTKKKK